MANTRHIDLKGHRAQRADAESDSYSFTLGDGDDEETFYVPPVGDWPVEFFDQLAEGGMGAALRELVGITDYERLRKHRLTIDEVNYLVESVTDQAGVPVGNSSGSGSSSPSTQKKSRSTSKSITDSTSPISTGDGSASAG